MENRKLWDTADQSSEYKSVCDVYGAEHLARLIGMSASAFLDLDATPCHAMPRHAVLTNDTSVSARAVGPNKHGPAISLTP